MTVQAAVYTRISKDQRNGQGVKRQETLCRKLAEDKGWEVAGVYSDNDISAYSGKPRPAYAQMLDDLRSGDVNAVVCVDLDRLTRRPAELEEFIVLADQLGTHLANVSGDVDLSTSDGRFRARIMGAVARQESEKKSERIIRANDQRRAAGAPHLGGYRPYGYKRARTADGTATWQIVPSEAERIRQGVDEHLAGKSLNQIAKEWNAAGVRTTRGNPYSATTVRRVLASPLYAAILPVGKDTTPGNWEPIIDRATHEAMRAKAESRKGQGNGGGRPAKHLLTGMVRCSYCGGAMHWRTDSRGVPQYRHFAKVERERCTHPGLLVNATALEKHVTREVLSRLDSPEVRTEMNRPIHDATMAKLEQAEAALDALFHDRYVREIVSDRHYVEGSKALNERIAHLTAELATPPPPSRLLLVDPNALDAKPVLLRPIAKQLIDRVEISEGTSGNYDEGRTRIIWR